MPHLIRMATRRLGLTLALLPFCCLPVGAQTTVSLNLDYAEGKYGQDEKSTDWTMPLIVRHRAGDFGIKLYLPYIRSTGLAASGGDRFVISRQTQEGFGDLEVTLSYDVVNHEASGLVLALGSKTKLATADKDKELLTTGKNDYSLQGEISYPFGNTEVFAILGKTKKGDQRDLDYRNPWYSTVGLSHQLAEAVNLGAIYDYRQRVTTFGDPVSEATLFLEKKLSGDYKLQGYVLRGFSDASPDLGAGVTLSKRF